MTTMTVCYHQSTRKQPVNLLLLIGTAMHVRWENVLLSVDFLLSECSGHPSMSDSFCLLR